jgi:hypothetical protein
MANKKSRNTKVKSFWWRCVEIFEWHTNSQIIIIIVQFKQKQKQTRKMFGRLAVRNFATAAAAAAPAAVKAKPIARESTFVRVWIKVPAAWPVFAITGMALGMSAYKIGHDIAGPDYHFNRHERSTIDYVENDRDASKVVSWSQTALHRGPEFIRSMMIKKE